MACVNSKQQSSSRPIVDDLNSLSLFGKCQPEDLIFNDHEEREKERKFNQALLEREKELKIQEKTQKENDEAYRRYLKKETREQQKMNGISCHTPPPKTCGRGTILNNAVNNSVLAIKSRGRGRLSPHELECLPLFERTKKVQKNLNLFDTQFHNNTLLKKYWTELGSNTNKEEVLHQEHKFYLSQAEFEDNKAYSSYTDSSSISDQYEDAQTSSHSSPQLFNSVLSHHSSSPVPAASPVQKLPHSTTPSLSPPQPQTRPYKPRPSRLAAKFSYNVEEDINEETPHTGLEQKKPSEEEEEAVGGRGYTNEKTPHTNIEQWYPLEKTFGVARMEDCKHSSAGSHGAPTKFRMGCRSVGTSFKSLNPSQRVLPNKLLRPEDICDTVCNNRDFTLNLNDFPAL